MIEDGVCQVTNWILGPGEMLLNAQQNVGYDVVSAEDLRRNHETLELQCRVRILKATVAVRCLMHISCSSF